MWSKDQHYGNSIRAWLTTYSKILYFLSIITGSGFSATEICNSNLFGLPFFNMGLSRVDMQYFRHRRIFSTVLGEVMDLYFIFRSYQNTIYLNIYRIYLNYVCKLHIHFYVVISMKLLLLQHLYH